MGKFLSKETFHSIDVSGTNNYVVVLNGVSINISSILNNITRNILQENQKVFINVTLISVMVTLILTIFIVSIIFSFYMRRYQAYWELLIQRIIIDIQQIQVTLQNTNTNLR